MARPTAKEILRIFNSIDWTGHFDLPIEDLNWLAHALEAKLRGPADLCGACGRYKEVIVDTLLGGICEACLKQANADAARTRKRLEGV